jgi:hypothetical protein
MRIEAALHARWAENEALAAIIPPERFTTGPARGATALPYAVLLRGPDRPLALASGGARLDSIRVEIHIWASHLDDAQTIAEMVQDLYERAAFACADGVALDMRPAGRRQTVHPDAAGQVVLEYDVLAQPLVAEI